MSDIEKRIDDIKDKELNLELLRTLVDEIDEEICLLLAERHDITFKIGVHKAINQLNNEDGKREGEQNDKFTRLASRYQLDEAYLVDTFSTIRSEVKSTHQKIKDALKNKNR